MRSAWIRNRDHMPGAAGGLSSTATQRRAWRGFRLLAGILALCAPLQARPPEWKDWSFAAASRHADAVVFARASQRLAVRSGDRIADSPWTLVAIDGDRIWLRAAESQSQRELLRPLVRGESLPDLPAPRDLGLEAVEVPVIDVATDETRSP